MKWSAKLFISIFIISLLSSCIANVYTTVTHDNISHTTQGAITTNSSVTSYIQPFIGTFNGSIFNFQYEWKQNGIIVSQSQNLSGLRASNKPFELKVIAPQNTYFVIGPLNFSAQYSIEDYVLCDVSWLANGGSLTTFGAGGIKKTGAPGVWSNAYSQNILPSGSDGFVEFQVPTNNIYNYFAVGLSPLVGASSASSNVSSVRYEIVFFLGYFFLVDNVNPNLPLNCVTGSLGQYQANDMFKIVKTGSTMSIFQNNIQIQTAGVGSGVINNVPNCSYIAQSAFWTQGASCNYVRTSFCNEITPEYAELKKELDGSFYVVNGKLGILYKQKYNDPKLNYRIYDLKRNVVADNTTAPISAPLTAGYNYIMLDLTTQITNATSSSPYYVLEVTDAKGEVYKLRFKYNN